MKQKVMSRLNGSRSFWTLAKQIEGNFSRSSFPPITCVDGIVATASKDKAEVFAKTFAASSTLNIPPSIQAFDQPWHASLLNKLPSYGLPVKLCDWLADFLSGRKITVVVDGFSSSFHNINAGVPQGSVLAPKLFLLHINDLLSSTTNPIHSFADDSILHASIISNRPISVVELERRRLPSAASLSKDLEAITAWGLKNMVELNASKTKYCALSNKRCPSEYSVVMNNQALSRTAGKKLGYLFRARKYFSPSNLLTLYKAQIRPSLEYCSHIWGAAAPTTLSILDAV
nr:unnamed protein product [Callosobruchus chinensis]